MKRDCGFTLVEVLAALAVLSVGLIPIFQMVTASTRLTGRIQNKLIAGNLAQEGAEVVRAMRDRVWFLEGSFEAWADTMVAQCASGCGVAFNSTAPIIFPQPPPRLSRDPATGLFQYSTGTQTIFTRTITVAKISSFSVKVTSQVSWMEHLVFKTNSVESYLFNWLE